MPVWSEPRHHSRGTYVRMHQVTSLTTEQTISHRAFHACFVFGWALTGTVSAPAAFLGPQKKSKSHAQGSSRFKKHHALKFAVSSPGYIGVY